MKLFLSGIFALGKINFIFRRIHFLLCIMPLILTFSTFGREAQLQRRTPFMEKNCEGNSFYNCFMYTSCLRL